MCDGTDTQTDGHGDSTTDPAQRAESVKTILHSCPYIEFSRNFLLLPSLAMFRTFIESLAFHCMLQKCNKIVILGIFVI